MSDEQGRNKMMMWLSRNRHTSRYMQWYWRRLPEVQPLDIITPLGRIKWIVRDGELGVCDICALEAVESPDQLDGVDQHVWRRCEMHSPS